ncbi:uncharacterized protein LOC142776872 [Rhipicephalus microplus]|uniref:uncharacterized protein LOC142776872 n=1 Tax=Rhipicephalus microplus TaxID=6941 RepID=UPI003F6B7CBF
MECLTASTRWRSRAKTPREDDFDGRSKVWQAVATMFPTQRPLNRRPCATTPRPTSQEPIRCGRLTQDPPVKQALVKRVHDYASSRKRRAPVSYQVLTFVYIEATRSTAAAIAGGRLGRRK